ncbi:hypothetical protein AAMO2058_000134300 [Amorphochlora amoebiformis]
MGGQHPGVLLLFLLAWPASGDIHHYKNTQLNLGTYLVRRGDMYSPRESPSHSSPGNGKAYIDVELVLRRHNSSKLAAYTTEGEIEFAVIHSAEKLNISYSDGEQKYFCCVAELEAKGETKLCNKETLNTLIIRNKHVERKKAAFHSGDELAKTHRLITRFNVEKSGPYMLVMANCDPRLQEYEVSFSGRTIWMNPYGYLPATSYAFLPFYGIMACIYGGLAIVWFVLNAMHWKEIVMLQNYITVVLGVCLIENMLLYFDYAHFNLTGTRGISILVAGAFVTILRRAIARMLIMAVSIGFAIVRPDLGKNKKNIINFGLVYFFLGFTQQLLIDLAKVHTSISDHLRTILLIPVAAADSGCYWFIFISLYHLITMLRVRQQLVKLSVYKTFTKVLVVSLLCATVFSIYHLSLTIRQKVLVHWRIWWLLDEGIWNILFSIIFFAICFLFRPSQSAKRYAYTQTTSLGWMMTQPLRWSQ